MTRFLLTWIGFTVLQVGAPRSTCAAELRRGGESTRLTAQLEVLSSDVLLRQGIRGQDLRTVHTPPPFAGTASPPLSAVTSAVERATPEPERTASTSLAFLRPEARAPPA